MPLYCGIDLHSRNNQMVIMDEKEKRILERKENNDLAEVLSTLDPYRENVAGIAVESTPNWYWLVDGLMDAGYKVHLVNTTAAKQYSGLKYRNDRDDARWLAKMLILGILPEGYIYPREQRAVRDLLRHRIMLLRHRTSLLLNLRAIYSRSSGKSVSGYEIIGMTMQEIEEIVGQRQISLAIEASAYSIEVISHQLSELEKELLSCVKDCKAFALLRTISGVGPILAMTIFLETGDIRRFRKVGNYASYCRCVRSEWFSNDKKKGSGNRKNGNPYLSWSFTQAACRIRKNEPRAERFYQRKRKQCNHILAIRALSNKLARATYWILRNEKPFDTKLAFA